MSLTWISSSPWLSVFLSVCVPVCLAVHVSPVEKAAIVLERGGGGRQWQGQAKQRQWLHRSWSTSGYQQCWDSQNEGAMQTRMGIVQKRQSALQGRSELKLRRDWGSAVSGLWHRISVKLRWGTEEAGKRDQRWERGKGEKKKAGELKQEGQGQWKQGWVLVSLVGKNDAENSRQN